MYYEYEITCIEEDLETETTKHYSGLVYASSLPNAVALVEDFYFSHGRIMSMTISVLSEKPVLEEAAL